MNILADASLPGLDEAFPHPFCLTKYDCTEDIPDLLLNQDILFCRASLNVNGDLLKNQSLSYVATASSGTDHIDKPFLKAHHIKLIDAKGCNAVAVADYVLSCIAYLEEQLGFSGKNIGIIGMGHVGTMVHQHLRNRGFNPLTFDPLKEMKEAHFKSCKQDALYSCDMLCIHAELHEAELFPTVNLIDDTFLSKLKPACVLINASRGGIVNEEAILRHQSIMYCTDVFLNEPAIDERMINRATLCTPHIAGHSLEAKYKAVAIVSKQLHQLYNHPLPKFAEPPKVLEFSSQQSWNHTILSIYNPMEETMKLKEAKDKTKAFLNLRKCHQHRHDFSVYSCLLK